MASIWYSTSTVNTVYRSTPTGTVDKSFAAPDDFGHALGYDPDGSLWYTGTFGNEIQLLDQTGALVSTVTSPSSQPRGIAESDDACLWHQDDNSDKAYEIAQSTETVTKSFNAPSDFPEGIVQLGTNDCLWITDGDGTIYETDTNGTIASSFAITFTANMGVGADADDSIWAATTASHIVKYDQTGTEISSFTANDFFDGGGVTTTDEPLGTTGGTTVTDTAVKTSVAHSPFQTTEVGIGTVQAVQEAFGHRSRKAQPAKVWFDETEQWDSARQNAVSHASDVVSITTGETEGFIIPSQQNWEG